jgi:CRP-like cAMP-binding protein
MGTVEIVVCETLKFTNNAPSFFGEISLFRDCERSADVVAMTFCVAETLSKQNLDWVCSLFGDMKQRLMKNVA